MTGTAMSGRPFDELTVERVCDGDLTDADIRIHPVTLEHQAKGAVALGTPQLAESLRRGAEMAVLDDDELMHIYESLRPGRSSIADLQRLADDLASRGMPRCAALVREAADVYGRRKLST
jgi:propanediol dehydratase small subunit